MTMIVFDGTCLVADGASTVREENMKRLFNDYHKTKIIVPNFDFKDEETGTCVKALAGTGVSNDIADVMDQILIIGRMGGDVIPHLTSLQALLKNRTDCQIVAVCTKGSTQLPEVFATSLFCSGSYVDETFSWESTHGRVPAIAGVNVDIPEWELGDGWSNSVEIVSFGSALFPERVGGLLTRYNIITGELDHPKHTGKEIMQGMYDRFRKEELYKVRQRFSKVKDFINNPTNTY